ncbi:hypothetical protein ACHAWF_008014 [Thalassiosira exigua]
MAWPELLHNDPFILAATLCLGVAIGAALAYRKAEEKVAASKSKVVLAKPKVIRPPLPGHHPKYPFENVAFQGGGACGTVYIGAIQAMDELGMLPYLKRFAGTSAGTVAALVLALRLDAEQAAEEMEELDASILLDGDYLGPKKNSYFGTAINQIFLATNLLKKLGMHPGDTLTDFVGNILKKYAGDSELTFAGLYKEFGTELCVCVANLSRKQSEYFHVTTTPDVKIKYAMRASMSIPFIFQPQHLRDNTDVYVDGALFNNYPLKAYDGWFLSTSNKDDAISQTSTIIKEAQSADHDSTVMKALHKVMSSSFVEPNMLSIGFRLDDLAGCDQSRYAAHLHLLEQRISRGWEWDDDEEEGEEKTPLPQTKLARAYMRREEDRKTKQSGNPLKYDEAYAKMEVWKVKHSDCLFEENPKYPRGISSALLIKALNEDPPGFDPQVLGFISWGGLVDKLDRVDSPGIITSTEWAAFWEKFNVRNAYMKNRKPASVTNAFTELMEILESMRNVSEEPLLKDPNNTVRTCILNTQYINPLDFDMEPADKEFLYKSGKKNAIKFLKKHGDEMRKARKTV